MLIFAYFVFITLTEEVFSNEDEAENTLDTKSKKPCFEDILTHWPTDVAGSHIWDEQVRTEVKEAKIPEHELNRKRSELLVPGSRLALSEEEISHIPLLLVQLPGCREGKYLYSRCISLGQECCANNMFPRGIVETIVCTLNPFSPEGFPIDE